MSYDNPRQNEYEGDGPYQLWPTDDPRPECTDIGTDAVYCPTCAWSGDDDQVTVGVLVDGDREILQPERCPQCGSQQLFSIGEQPQ